MSTKAVFSTIIGSTLILALVMPFQFAGAQEQNTTTVGIMKHLCESDINSVADFEAMEAQAGSGVEIFVHTEWNCPVIRNPGDSPVQGAKAGANVNFAFILFDSDGVAHNWNDGTFTTQVLCEDDINRDFDGDNVIESTVCADRSYYEFEVAEGPLVIIETTSPDGALFGAVRFMPTELFANNDESSHIATHINNSVVLLNTEDDTDNSVMLHVYNFQEENEEDEENEDDDDDEEVAQMCNGKVATIYVHNGKIVGGPDDGETYHHSLRGTLGNDVIVGTTANEDIDGKHGNDVICAGAGNDRVDGGLGNDWINGEEGNDHINGSLGDDHILGMAGNDHLMGSLGDDELEGGAGNDSLDGNIGSDHLDGGANTDSLFGGLGNDTCLSGENNHSCES